MRRLTKLRRRLLLWTGLSCAPFSLLAGAPAQAAVDKSLAACMAESAAITAADEATNAGVDAAAEAADVGLPVMDVGIVLSLNQINANLADLLGPITAIAKSTCDTNDTLSTSAKVTDFVGWTDADDTEPLPAVIPAQIDGTIGLASAPARAVDMENTAAVRAMELNLKDGYAAALADNQLKGLANMEGIGLSGIAAEKVAILAAAKNLEKLKLAGNVKDLVAMQGALLNSVFEAVMRSNIISEQQEVGANQRERFRVNERQMIRDDHLATAKMLAL